ncbi:MAG TPA: hypothetical protein VKD72_34960 [Gemmataceae bacterium]|nr:hypothetical protein [Gemmataceae bacterium]
MSQEAIFLHFGHVASGDAAFFLATLVYVPVGAIALVAAMDVGARNGVRLARHFMARYDRAGMLAKAAAFLLVLSSSFNLGYLPSHFKLAPMAAALFSLDAAVLMGSSVLVVTLPALRPAAVILMGAGIVAYMVGGVQLDATALAAKGIEVLALVLLLAAIVRTGVLPEQEEPTSTSIVTVDAPPPARDNVGRPVQRRARGGGKQSRRRTASRSGS